MLNSILNNLFMGQGANEQVDMVSIYDELIKKDPKNSTLYVSKALDLRSLGRFAEAVDAYNQALKLNPKDAMSHNNKAALLQDLHRDKEAIEAYNHATKIHPKYSIAHGGRGTALKNLGEYKESIKSFDTALKYDKNNTTALNGKGLSLKLLGQHEEALLCIKKAIQINPNLLHQYTNTTDPLLALGRYDEAILYCNKALNKNANFQIAHINKAIALSYSGKIPQKEILLACDKALNFCPNDITILELKLKTSIKMEQYKQSVEIGEKFFMLAPEKLTTEFANIMGFICLHLEKPNSALKYFDLLIKSDQNTQYYRACCFMKIGQYDKVLESLEIHLKIHHDDIKAEFLLFEAQNKLGIYVDDVKMLRLISKVQEISKDTKLPVMLDKYKELLINFKSHEKNDNKHKLLLEKLHEQVEDPNRSVGDRYFLKAALFEQSEKYEDAIIAYKEAIKLEENNEHIYFGYGALLYKLAKYQDALSILDNGLEINPNNAAMLSCKGFALAKLDKNKEAIDYYHKALKINALDGHTYNALGCSLLKVKKYEESLACLDKTIDIDSKIPGVLSNKGIALTGLGRYKEALEFFNRAEIEDIDNIDTIYMNKAITLEKVGEYAKALGFYDKALDINPKDRDAYYNKGNTLSIMEKKLEAIHCYEKAIEIDTKDTEAYKQKSHALFSLGRVSEAFDTLYQAWRITPDDPSIYYFIASKLISLGKYDLAEEYFIEKIASDITEESEMPKIKIKEEVLDIQKTLNVSSNKIEELTESSVSSPKELDNLMKKIVSDTKNYNNISELKQKKEDLEKQKILDNSVIQFVHHIQDADELDSETTEMLIDKAEELPELSVNHHQALDRLMTRYVNSKNQQEKEEIKHDINYKVHQNPSLKGFVLHLFKTNSLDYPITTMEEIFSNNPSLVHKFYQHKKEDLTSIISRKKNTEYVIKTSDEIEGLHKIKTNENLKFNWLFKFSKKIIEKLSDLQVVEKLEPRINELSIVKEDMKGKIGFKKHEIKTEDVQNFSLLKLVGLNKNCEMYATQAYKYYDPISSKTDTLSVLNNFDNHKKLQKIINGSSIINAQEEYMTLNEFSVCLSGDLE